MQDLSLSFSSSAGPPVPGEGPSSFFTGEVSALASQEEEEEEETMPSAHAGEGEEETSEGSVCLWG